MLCRLHFSCIMGLKMNMRMPEGDKGRVRIAIHQELPWARSISNEEFKLFMMEQTWATGADLEAHIGSAHAMGFNAAMLKHRMLVTEPSVSIFGEPLTAEQLRALAQEVKEAKRRRREASFATCGSWWKHDRSEVEATLTTKNAPSTVTSQPSPQGALALRCMGPLRLSDGSAVRWLRSLRTAPGLLSFSAAIPEALYELPVVSIVVNDAASEASIGGAYSEDTPPSAVSEAGETEEEQGEVAPIQGGEVEDRLGTPSEVDEAVDPVEEQPRSVHSDSNSEIERPPDAVEVASATEEAPEEMAEVASAGSEDIQPTDLEEEEVARTEGASEQPVEEESSAHIDILVTAVTGATAVASGTAAASPAGRQEPTATPAQEKVEKAPVPQPYSDTNESDGFAPSVHPQPTKPQQPEIDEVRSDPETDGDLYYDEDHFESSATQSVAKSLRTESRSMRVDSPSQDEAYTSAYHSDRSDSEGSEEEEEEPDSAETEALKTELAAKEDEQDKLSEQMLAMQREMEALRKLLQEQQQELASSSQELQRARAELDALRQEQEDSAKASKAEKEAFRQVEKLMKERKSLKEQLEKLQEQMAKMESLQEKLQQRLRATELERDAIRQRLQAEAQLKKPHRIDEAESARLRTGGEFRPYEHKPTGPAAKPRRRREGAKQRRGMARGGTGDVWCFQPRSKAALAIRVLPSLRPAGKDPLAPYRLPEGNRMPGKIRQDHVTTHLARPRLPMIPKPVRDNRVPWH
ncbi:Reticulocyte-binding protein 2-like a [Symbiodinium microadriaticum]|uniref:Reticulocyte-binding protein 2-like a n=1 Tax=Symbiodinium microadriaticum TaxID=2951 RepID=A0A1Q9CLD0_SYMMI|nr:Reticulocyte-binding protein 2-like a [Symbiodinium microadriaticum]